MKKLILLLLFFVTASCASVMKPQQYNRMVTTSAVDFRPYTSQGFLFTPESYENSYEAVAYLNCLAIPEEDYEIVQRQKPEKTKKRPEDYEDIYYNPDLDKIPVAASRAQQQYSTYYELTLKEDGKLWFEHALYEPMQPIVVLKSEILDPQELYDSIFYRCIEMGADAFVNLKQTQMERPLNNKSSLTTTWYQIEGYAIRRMNE